MLVIHCEINNIFSYNFKIDSFTCIKRTFLHSTICINKDFVKFYYKNCLYFYKLNNCQEICKKPTNTKGKQLLVDITQILIPYI